MDNDDNTRGFAGLASLASDLSIPPVATDPGSSSPHTMPPQTDSRPVAKTETRRETAPSSAPISVVRHKRHRDWGAIASFCFIGFIVVMWLFSDDNKSSSRRSYQAPSAVRQSYGNFQSSGGSSRTYSSLSTPSGLAAEIDVGKAKATDMEGQLKSMDERLESYDRQLKYYDSAGMITAYNQLVPAYNSLLRQRKQLYSEYSSLIDDVNAKVKRYNAGSR